MSTLHYFSLSIHQVGTQVGVCTKLNNVHLRGSRYAKYIYIKQAHLGLLWMRQVSLAWSHVSLATLRNLRVLPSGHQSSSVRTPRESLRSVRNPNAKEKSKCIHHKIEQQADKYKQNTCKKI